MPRRLRQPRSPRSSRPEEAAKRVDHRVSEWQRIRRALAADPEVQAGVVLAAWGEPIVYWVAPVRNNGHTHHAEPASRPLTTHEVVVKTIATTAPAAVCKLRRPGARRRWKSVLGSSSCTGCGCTTKVQNAVRDAGQAMLFAKSRAGF